MGNNVLTERGENCAERNIGEHCGEREIGGILCLKRDWGHIVLREARGNTVL